MFISGPGATKLAVAAGIFWGRGSSSCWLKICQLLWAAMGARLVKTRFISTRGNAAAGLLLGGAGVGVGGVGVGVGGVGVGGVGVGVGGVGKIGSGVHTSPPKGSGMQAAQLGRAEKPVKANEIAVNPPLSSRLKILC